MRISTNQIFLSGLSGIQKRQAEVFKYLKQGTSGQKVETPSDDPITSAKIELMKQRLDSSGVFQENAKISEGILAFEESVLGNSAKVIMDIKDLQVQAGNAALSIAERKSLADQALNLLDQLQGLANTQDSNGFYIFSGSKSLSQSISKDTNGQYIYNGDDSQRIQSVSAGINVILNDTASSLFMNIKNGNGRFTVSQGAVTNLGSGVVSSGSVSNQAALITDDYTIQFALNTQNKLVVMVSGASSGNVIPPTGLPDDAPLYSSDQTITFNGMSVAIKGEPVAGDQFEVKPAQNESLFSTVQRMITNLKRPVGTPAEKAIIETENNQISEQLKSALDMVLQYQSQSGSRLNQLEVATTVNDSLIASSTEIYRTLSEVNIEEAFSNYKIQMIYLQAAQQSFMKIQEMSIFNYMR